MADGQFYSTLSPLIEASLSPVFLLSAIGVTLSVVDTRQNRIVDRVRVLERMFIETSAVQGSLKEEMSFYMNRARRIGWAAVMCIVSALCVALVVVTLLVDAQTPVRLGPLVEAVFAVAVLSYGGALVLFLRDILLVNRGMAFVQARVMSEAKGGGAGQ